MADPPLDYRAIDDTIHGRVRLATMAYLSGAECADFADLRARTGVSDGNLSVHLRKLEDAGYVSIEKRFEGKKPVTTACMTDVGREAWIVYLDRMKAMLFGDGAE